MTIKKVNREEFFISKLKIQNGKKEAKHQY